MLHTNYPELVSIALLGHYWLSEMVSRGTANNHMGFIKSTFTVLVIVGFVGTIESSNLRASVKITVLKNAVTKGAGK